jgi:hypothetical protein
MTEEELKTFADKLITDTTKADAIFGIYQHGGSDESYIKANKAGLQIFATELLYASLKCDSIIKDKEKNVIPLDYEAEWVAEDGETFLQYIEPLQGTREKPILKPAKSQIKNDIYKYGCIMGLLFIVACIMTGFVTILKSIL